MITRLKGKLAERPPVKHINRRDKIGESDLVGKEVNVWRESARAGRAQDTSAVARP